jgi:hypothetical protein
MSGTDYCSVNGERKQWPNSCCYIMIFLFVISIVYQIYDTVVVFQDDKYDIPLWFKIWRVIYIIFFSLATYIMYQHCTNCDAWYGFGKFLLIAIIVAVIDTVARGSALTEILL